MKIFTLDIKKITDISLPATIYIDFSADNKHWILASEATIRDDVALFDFIFSDQLTYMVPAVARVRLNNGVIETYDVKEFEKFRIIIQWIRRDEPTDSGKQWI